MRGYTQFAAAFAVSLALAGPVKALDAPAGIQTSDTAIGTVLASSKGKTLYTFDEDSAGKSSCYGKCSENWPPLKAKADAATVGKFSVVEREDGVAQWAYEGKPLYLWVRDKAPGDTSGDGVRGWRAARP